MLSTICCGGRHLHQYQLDPDHAVQALKENTVIAGPVLSPAASIMRVSVHFLYVRGSCYVENLFHNGFCLICQVLKIIIVLVCGSARFTVAGGLFLGFEMF